MPFPPAPATGVDPRSFVFDLRLPSKHHVNAEFLPIIVDVLEAESATVPLTTQQVLALYSKFCDYLPRLAEPIYPDRLFDIIGNLLHKASKDTEKLTGICMEYGNMSRQLAIDVCNNRLAYLHKFYEELDSDLSDLESQGTEVKTFTHEAAKLRHTVNVEIETYKLCLENAKWGFSTFLSRGYIHGIAWPYRTYKSKFVPIVLASAPANVDPPPQIQVTLSSPENASAITTVMENATTVVAVENAAAVAVENASATVSATVPAVAKRRGVRKNDVLWITPISPCSTSSDSDIVYLGTSQLPRPSPSSSDPDPSVPSKRRTCDQPADRAHTVKKSRLNPPIAKLAVSRGYSTTRFRVSTHVPTVVPVADDTSDSSSQTSIEQEVHKLRDRYNALSSSILLQASLLRDLMKREEARTGLPFGEFQSEIIAPPQHFWELHNVD